MNITTDEYQYDIKKAPDSSFVEVSSSKEGMELFLDSLELCGTNPHQKFPPERTKTGAVLILPEVLVLWFGFEVLNYGV